MNFGEQRAGARLLIIVQSNNDALQRVGASGEIVNAMTASHVFAIVATCFMLFVGTVVCQQAESIGIPAILITTEAGNRLQQVLSSCVNIDSSTDITSSCIRLSIEPNQNRDVAEAWVSLAHTLWSDDPRERTDQLKEALFYHHMDGERQSWIRRQLARLKSNSFQMSKLAP